MTLSIWSDPDVAAVADFVDGRPFITSRGLAPSDEPVALMFVEADSRLAASATTGEEWLSACMRGARAYESFSSDVARGWRKFVLYQVGEDACIMWDRFRLEETRMFADWVVARIERNKWGPDGRSTPLGEMHGWCMGLQGETGGGIYFDVTSGRAEAASGAEAVAFVDRILPPD